MRKPGHIFFIIFCLCLLIGFGADLLPKAQAASAMTASEDCVTFIKGVEGFSPQPYYDYNQYTVGYGTKCPTEKYFDYNANGIPRSEAEALLREHLAELGDTLNQKLIDKYNLSLNQHQFDALISFSFNIGTGWITYDSTLRNAILRNAGENDMVYAFGLYCTAGGKYLPGLITRRLCEANMYLNGVYDHKISDAYGYVYYDANGGTLTYRVQGFVCDNNSVPAANAVHSSSEFLGWYTNLTGGSQVTVLDRALTGRTLFARWQSSESPDGQPSNSTSIRVTGDIVNIRSGPGTNYGIVRKAYQNEVLTLSHVTHLTNMRWGHIQDGWICLDYTNYDAVLSGAENEDQEVDDEIAAPADPAPVIPDSSTDTPPANPMLVSGIVKVNDALRIRSGPGTTYAVVGFLFNGREIDILEQETVGSMVWGRIANGWVSMDYVETDDYYIEKPGTPDAEQEAESQPETEPETEQIPETEPEQEPIDSAGQVEAAAMKGKIKADALRIRSGAGTQNAIVGFYYENNVVYVTEKVLVNDVYWGKTEKGWINLDYFVPDSLGEEKPQPAEGRNMTVIADCLRVRKGTSTDNRIAALLYYGDTVVVFETVTVDGTVWGRVDKGWICMDYVS